MSKNKRRRRAIEDKAYVLISRLSDILLALNVVDRETWAHMPSTRWRLDWQLYRRGRHDSKADDTTERTRTDH